jgi:hypothetical protein
MAKKVFIVYTVLMGQFYHLRPDEDEEDDLEPPPPPPELPEL